MLRYRIHYAKDKTKDTIQGFGSKQRTMAAIVHQRETSGRKEHQQHHHWKDQQAFGAEWARKPRQSCTKQSRWNKR